MICVSIGRTRHTMIQLEHKALAEKGAELVELRLDYLGRPPELSRLLNGRPTPVVVTCRRPVDQGRWRGTEEQRQALLRAAIVADVEYVDLEEDVAGLIPRFGKTKRIVSLHDYRKTPDNLEEIHARLASLDADIVKLATTANNTHDNVRMLQLMAAAKVPTVGICMGDIGTPSRILAGRFGAPFTFATFHHERTLAPGQLSYQQMTEIYHYDQIDRQTVIYGVIGDPIGHSLSPIIHNAAFRKLGINAVYVPFRVPREHLGQFIDDAPALGIKGLSVTIPHKEAVIKKLTESDATMSGIGAVNTLIFGDGGKITGYNTDQQAALDSLELALSDHRGRRESLEGRMALVLGAGGAAKAIGFGLKRMGAQVAIAGRTAARAQQLADALGCKTLDWANRYSVQPDLLVDCTPVGMHPNVDATPYDKHHLRPSMIVFDTVYNPENTLLVKEAQSQSCTVVTGVEMFVRQACLQFKLFTGQEAPAELMREALKRAIGPARC